MSFKDINKELGTERPMAVFNKLQAEKVDGKFVTEGARVEQVRVKVFVDIAEAHNAKFEETGSFYVVNEEANKEFVKLAKAKLAEKSKSKK